MKKQKTKKMSLQDVANKVGWEGGVLELLGYGLTADNIEDETLASQWKEAEELYRKLNRIVESIEMKLEGLQD